MTNLEWLVDFSWAFIHSALFFTAAFFLAAFALGCAAALWALFDLENPFPSKPRPWLRAAGRGLP